MADAHPDYGLFLHYADIAPDDAWTLAYQAGQAEPSVEDIIERFGSLSNDAIRRICDAGEATIRTRNDDGVTA